MIPDYLTKVFKQKQENKKLEKIMGTELTQQMIDAKNAPQEFKVVEVEKFKQKMEYI